MKKRPRRKASKPPPERARRGGTGRRPQERTPGILQYKVVELSTVDEGALERAINTWVRAGWNLDGVQFAMRESSKRPSMAFVFFTREAERAEPSRAPDEATAHLSRIAGAPVRAQPAAEPRPDPRQRLAELAGEAPEGERALEPLRWVDPGELEDERK